MTVNTDTPELKELTIESLKRASESFGFMIRKQVEMKEITLQKMESTELLDDVVKENMYLLTTEIIGDMKGKSYFLFDKDVSEKIFELCTGMKLGSSSLTVDAVLKEIDNIVSASMISVLADKLKLSIFGDVPHCFEYSRKDILKEFEKDYNQYASGNEQYLITCALVTEEGMKVDFFWILSGDIINRVKN